MRATGSTLPIDLAMLGRIAHIELEFAERSAGVHGRASDARIDRAMLHRIARVELDNADGVAAAQAKQAASVGRLVRIIADRMAPVFSDSRTDLAKTRSGGTT